MSHVKWVRSLVLFQFHKFVSIWNKAFPEMKMKISDLTSEHFLRLQLKKAY